MKDDFTHFNSSPGESLSPASLDIGDKVHDFDYPDGYTPVADSLLGRPGSTSVVSVVINNADGREYAIKTPHSELIPTMGKIEDSYENLAQSAEIFTNHYLADFKGGVRIARIHRAGRNYTIKDKFENLRPFDDFDFSTEVVQRACLHLAEYMCFMHFPTADKGPLLADYATRIRHNPEKRNTHCGFDGFYCVLDTYLESMDAKSLKELAEILNSEEANPCVSHNDWDGHNVKISSEGVCLYDLGSTKLGGRLYDITEFCDNRSHDVSRLMFQNYIKIYNEKYKGRAV